MGFLQRKLNLKGWLNYIKAVRKDKGFPYQGIHVVCGQQGSGKTAYCVHSIFDILKQFPDAKLVSNVHIEGIDYIPYKGIESFELTNGTQGIIYFIDEIQTLFSSLESKNIPVSTLTIWSQNRKNRRVILGTSQRFNRIAKPIREQCDNVVWHENLGFVWRYSIIPYENIDIEGRLDLKGSTNHYWVPDVKILNNYDTYYLIERNNYD